MNELDQLATGHKGVNLEAVVSLEKLGVMEALVRLSQARDESVDHLLKTTAEEISDLFGWPAATEAVLMKLHELVRRVRFCDHEVDSVALPVVRSRKLDGLEGDNE